jgi:hypothetical protein
MCRNVIVYDEELLAAHPTPKLEDHRLPAVRNCLFNTFALPFISGDRSSICNLRTSHAVVRDPTNRVITTNLYTLVPNLTHRKPIHTLFFKIHFNFSAVLSLYL